MTRGGLEWSGGRLGVGVAADVRRGGELDKPGPGVLGAACPPTLRPDDDEGPPLLAVDVLGTRGGDAVVSRDARTSP